MRTLLKNAKIYDGSGNEPFIGDCLVEDEKIIAVGESLSDSDAEVIDLTGKSLSSGFFDAHSHNDWFAIKKEPKKYFEPFVRQGMTSFIAGNCGLSAMGFDHESDYKDKIGAGLFHFDNVTGEYASFTEFCEAVHCKTPMNIASLVGHCTARASVSGNSNRPLSSYDREKMLALLERGLQEGACGISLGLMYEPGIYAQSDELKDVVSLCEKYDLPMTVHARACSAVSMSYANPLGRPHLLRALDELVELAKGTKLKLHYSHAIFVGKNSFKCKPELVSIIDKMRESDVDAMFDIYSEVCGVSVITVIMPVWYQALSPEEKRKPFNKLKFTVLVNISKTLLGFDFENILVAYLGEGNERFEGKNVHQIAQEMKISDIDAYLHLCEISNFAGRVIMGPYSTPEIISDLSKHESSLYMTDAWVEEYGVQNLAIYDCFPKFIHLALNGKGASMPETIRKMTGAVADRFSIKNRGYVRDGCFADLTVFDEDKMKNGTPDQNEPFGIDMVFINGKRVLNGYELDESAFLTAGHALRANN